MSFPGANESRYSGASAQMNVAARIFDTGSSEFEVTMRPALRTAVVTWYAERTEKVAGGGIELYIGTTCAYAVSSPS
jgi:hypothetical protein